MLIDINFIAAKVSQKVQQLPPPLLKYVKDGDLCSPANSRGLTQIFSVLFSAIFLCRGVTGVCALLLCAAFLGRHIGLPLRQNREPSVPGVFVTF